MNSIFSASKYRIDTRVSAPWKKGSGPFIKLSGSRLNFLYKVPPVNFKILLSNNNSEISTQPLPKLGLNFPKKRCLVPRTPNLSKNVKFIWRLTLTRYFQRSDWMWWGLGGWQVNFMHTVATWQLVTVIKRRSWTLLIKLQFQSKTKRMLIIELPRHFPYLEVYCSHHLVKVQD